MTIALTLAFLLLSLGPAPALAQGSAPRSIDVEGHQMLVRTGGMERLGRVPAVVLEAAVGDRLDTWNPIFDQLAAVAPVVAYDRAGLGGSPDNGRVPTPSQVARTLHALLQTIGVKPPYVLVGHSWGGLLVRMFAEVYPADVVGLVFIDPTDLRSLAEEEAYYKEQGYVGAAMVERKASLLRFPGADRGEFKVLVETVRGDFKEFRSLRPLPDVPVAVFMSAAFDPISWRNSPCAPTVCEEAIIKWRIKWLRDMMVGSTDATLTVATKARHHMHVDDPELILTGIHRVIGAAARRLVR